MYHKKRHRGSTTLLHVLVCIPMLLGPAQPVIGHRISEDVSTVEVSGGPDLASLPQEAGRASLQTSSITIQNSNFEGNKDYGLNSNITINAENNWWGDANGPTHASSPQGRGDAVSDNVDFDPWLPSAVDIGIPYSPPPGPGVVTLSQNSFEDNGSYGVQSSIPINAEYNWWGHPSGPYHPDTNPDGQGDAVSDLVDYEPWLASPPGMRRPTALTLGQPLIDSVTLNQYKDYKLITAAGLSIVVEVMPAGGSETLWVYSRLGDLPLWTRYDLRTQERTARGAYELLLSPTQNGTYYFSVYGRDVADTGGNYQIVANTVERYLSDVSPDSAGNAGEVTLTLSGLPFVDGIGIELRGAGLPTFAADSVTLASPTSLWAHFDLNGAATGVYDVYAMWPGGAEASLTDAFTVTAGTGPHLEAHLVAPEAVRPGRQYVLRVEYANTGDADMPTPLLRISAENASLRLPEQDNFAGSSIQLFATNPDGPFGVLPPGVGGRLSLIFRPGGSGGTARFSVSKLEPSESVVDNRATAISEQVFESRVQASRRPSNINSTEDQGVQASMPSANINSEPDRNLDMASQAPAVFIDNSHLVALEMFFQSDVEAFLESQPGSLKHYSVQVDDEQLSGAELVWKASLVQDELFDEQREAGLEFDLNPKLIIALLDSVNGVVSTSSPPKGETDLDGNALDLLQPEILFDLTERLGRAFVRYCSELSNEDKHIAATFALRDTLQGTLSQHAANRVLSADQAQSLVQSYESLFSDDLRQPLEVIPLQTTEWPTFVKPVDAPVGALYDHGNSGKIFLGKIGYVGYSGHQGYDYVAPVDTELAASFTGILFHRRSEIRGNPPPTLYAEVVTDINRDGVRDFKVRYDHLSEYRGTDGTEVQAGQPVGTVGRTGYSGDIPDHLHFETLRYVGEGPTGDMCDECNAGMMDPFGWWSDDQDPAPGNPESNNTWLWEATEASDDQDHSFQRFGFETGWTLMAVPGIGYRDRAWYTNDSHQWPHGLHKWAVWGLEAPHKGDFYIEVFVPDIPSIEYRENSQYTVFASAGTQSPNVVETSYTINQQANRGQWVRLDEDNASPIRLEGGEVVLVKLGTPSGSGGTYTVFDAVRLLDARPIGPTNLAASATGERSIHLEWTDNAANETGFKVFRDGEVIATVGIDVTSYDDNGLTCDTTYRYYVKAFNGAGDSDSSNVSVATTAGCPPGSFIEELLSWIISHIIRPIDPNDKIGPLGHGNTRTVSSEDTLHYTVNFENLATATAPVQELVVDDYLDPNLDWTTLQFDDIAYGDRIIVMPEDVFEFSGRDFPTSTSITGTTQGPMVIDMTVSLNPGTGCVKWRLRAIDTATEMPPEDPFAGFLPPEDGTGRGQGHVGFFIKPKADVALGTRITNTASIVFDTNDPIDTNKVWNTIGEPSLSVYLPIVLRSHP